MTQIPNLERVRIISFAWLPAPIAATPMGRHLHKGALAQFGNPLFFCGKLMDARDGAHFGTIAQRKLLCSGTGGRRSYPFRTMLALHGKRSEVETKSYHDAKCSIEDWAILTFVFLAHGLHFPIGSSSATMKLENGHGMSPHVILSNDVRERSVWIS